MKKITLLLIFISFGLLIYSVFVGNILNTIFAGIIYLSLKMDLYYE